MAPKTDRDRPRGSVAFSDSPSILNANATTIYGTGLLWPPRAWAMTGIPQRLRYLQGARPEPPADPRCEVRCCRPRPPPAVPLHPPVRPRRSLRNAAFSRLRYHAAGPPSRPREHRALHRHARSTGSGYGDDSSGPGQLKYFSGQVPDLRRVAHLERWEMPGGDLKTGTLPERMLADLSQTRNCTGSSTRRGSPDPDLDVLKKQGDSGVQRHDDDQSTAGY